MYCALISLSKYLPYRKDTLHGRLHLSLALSEPLECMLELWDRSAVNKFGHFLDAEWGPWGLSCREKFVLLFKDLPLLPPHGYWVMSSLNTINSVNWNVLRCWHSHIYKFCQSLRCSNSVKLWSLKMWEKTFTTPYEWFGVWSVVVLYDRCSAVISESIHISTHYNSYSCDGLLTVCKI